MIFARPQQTIKLTNRHVVFFPPQTEANRVREEQLRENVRRRHANARLLRRLLTPGPIVMGALLAFFAPLGLYLLWGERSRYQTHARISLTIVSLLGSTTQLLLLAALCHGIS